MRLLNKFIVRTEFSAKISLDGLDKTSREGLCAQYRKDIRSISSNNSAVCIKKKSGERSFISRINELSLLQLRYIDAFVNALETLDYRRVQDLISRYSKAPEKLVQMIDFISIEQRRRGSVFHIQLSAVVVRDTSFSAPFATVYVCRGWTNSGRPLCPKSFRTDVSTH